MLSGSGFLVFSFVLMLVTSIVMWVIKRKLLPAGCPGVISLELAFNEEKFRNIITQCGINGVLAHKILLWVDYIYLIAYASFLASLTHYLASGSKFASLFITLPILAGVLDAFENTFLLIQLSDTENINRRLVLSASVFASIKFGLIGISLISIIYYLIF